MKIKNIFEKKTKNKEIKIKSDFVFTTRSNKIENLKIKKEQEIKSKKISNFSKKSKNLKLEYQKKTTSKKILFSKYIIIIKTRCIISMIICFINLLYFEYLIENNISSEYFITILFFSILFLNFSSAFLYLLSIYFFGDILKIMSLIKHSTNVFFYFGIRKIFFYSILFLIPPIFYDDSFSQNYQVYFILINFTIHFFNTVICLIDVNRADNYFFFKNGKSIIDIIKLLLFENELKIGMIALLILWIYFSAVIRISEINLKNNNFNKKLLITKQFDNLFRNNFLNKKKYLDDYKNLKRLNNQLLSQNISNHNIFRYYKNCFWNTLITITTIGYGDMVVNNVLSKFYYFFISSMGLVIISFLIFSSQKFFDMDILQDKVYILFNKIESRDKMKKEAKKAFERMKWILYKKTKNLKEIKLKEKVDNLRDGLNSKLALVEIHQRRKSDINNTEMNPKSSFEIEETNNECKNVKMTHFILDDGKDIDIYKENKINKSFDNSCESLKKKFNCDFQRSSSLLDNLDEYYNKENKNILKVKILVDEESKGPNNENLDEISHDKESQDNKNEEKFKNNLNLEENNNNEKRLDIKNLKEINDCQENQENKNRDSKKLNYLNLYSEALKKSFTSVNLVSKTYQSKFNLNNIKNKVIRNGSLNKKSTLLTNLLIKLDTESITKNSQQFYKIKLKRQFNSIEIEKILKVQKYFLFSKTVEKDLKTIKNYLAKFTFLNNKYKLENKKSLKHFLKTFINEIDDKIDLFFFCIFKNQPDKTKEIINNFTRIERKVFINIINKL